MLKLDNYLQLRDRPVGRPAMLQNWRDLSFLHVRFEPDQIQRLLPSEITVDTFPDESGKEWAWLALVPFWMTGIRHSRLPRVPGTHTFCETNVRTYVHFGGQRPGVWFFSLDAANALACRVARMFFYLPYYFAQMSAKVEGDLVSYSSRRRWWPPESPPSVSIQTTITSKTRLAKPGTLEFFLAERYLLYAKSPKGRLFAGQVFHAPYPIADATARGDHSMFSPIGLQDNERWDHALYSPGVDVEVFSLLPVN
ncbi:MAG: DUF2071 domain-containing protein [Fimbriimonadaceae bacterium]